MFRDFGSGGRGCTIIGAGNTTLLTFKLLDMCPEVRCRSSCQSPIEAVLDRRAQIVAALSAIVPGEGVIASEHAMRPYESDGLTAYRQLPMVVVLPETTDQVSAVLRYCHDNGVKVVPRGAGTSLSGGALPLADGVLLGMGKFNRIREIDFDNRVVVAEPGVTNLAISARGRARGLLLRARSILADRLHHRRQRGGKFRRRALPQIRHDHQQHSRPRNGADDRRGAPPRRQASRRRRLRSPRHRHRLGRAARRRHRGDGAHPEEAGNRARRAGRLSRARRMPANASRASSARASFRAAWR